VSDVAADGSRTGRVGWVLDRLHSVSWAVLFTLWLVLGIWALRLGESIAALWVVTSALHLLLLPAWPMLLLAVLRHRRALTIAAGLTVAAQLAIAWPLLPWGGGSHRHGAQLTIASTNLYVDNPELERAGHQIAAHLPEVLVAQEFTPAARAAFQHAGITAHYRYRIEHVDLGTVGVAIYSMYPLREVPQDPAVPEVLPAIVTLPDGRHVRVLDVHLFPPQRGDPGFWERQIHRFDRELDRTPGLWVAIGDYNATIEHRVFRDLLHDGRRDAHLLTGRGYARSWPADLALPPLVLIDHALLSRGIGASATRERTVAGSDHRMIAVDLTL